jgi:serine/threonine protein kinase
VSDFGLSRKLNTESSLTCGFGSENFRAPEVEIECYDTSCDIWSFGILAGNLCEIPKLTFSQDCPEISEQEDDEYKDFIQNIGVRAAKKYSTNRASACLNVSRRFGGKEDDNDEHVNLLLEVVRSCLFLVPPRRASFDSIAEKFRSQKLFPVEFPVAFLDSVARENSEHKLNPKFVDQIRQKNQKLTLSSFEW